MVVAPANCADEGSQAASADSSIRTVTRLGVSDGETIAANKERVRGVERRGVVFASRKARRGLLTSGGRARRFARGRRSRALSFLTIGRRCRSSSNSPLALTTPAISTRHEQHQPDVLDRPLPALAHQRRVRAAHQLVHPTPPEVPCPAPCGARSGVSGGAVTDLRAFVPIVCRFCAKSADRPRVRLGARPRRHEHVPVARAAVARAVRARPGRGVPAARRPRGRAVRVRARAAGARAARRSTLRRRYRGQRFDIVHAHFGLTAWPALLARLGPVVVTLHGNDLLVRRSYVATRAALPFTALAAAVSREFSAEPARGGRDAAGRGPAGRDRPGSASGRSRARRRASASGSIPTARICCSRTIPSRPLKRYDRAVEAAGDVRAADARRRPARRGARTGSTPPTRCSCRRPRRASGSR